MKRLMFLLLLIISMVSVASSQNIIGKKVSFNQLPENSKTFFNSHFKTTSIKQIKEIRDRYNVKFNGNDEIDFYKKNGEWHYIAINSGVPSSILSMLPANITAYAKSNYPNFKIISIDRTKGYEVELENGLKLEFMPDGKFIKMKKGI